MAEPLDNAPYESQLKASKPLRDDLAALFATDVPVPPALDAAVLASARGHLMPRRRTRVVLRWAVAAAGAAAAAALLFVLALGPIRHAPEPVAMLPAPEVAKALAPEKADINHDGRVDVLDALALARELESKGPSKAEWDITGDGVVDRRDVDSIAQAVVRLERGTVQ